MCNKAADASFERYKDQETIDTFVYIFSFLVYSPADTRRPGDIP